MDAEDETSRLSCLVCLRKSCYIVIQVI